jgi:hypothetical protein
MHVFFYILYAPNCPRRCCTGLQTGHTTGGILGVVSTFVRVLDSVHLTDGSSHTLSVSEEAFLIRVSVYEQTAFSLVALCPV